MKKLLILGATGMLGNAVAKHFVPQTDKYAVTVTARNADLLKKEYPEVKSFFYDATRPLFLPDNSFDYVINCIGTIKPFMAAKPKDARFINAVMPWELADVCNKANAKLFHITTDCVFSGSKGQYDENSIHDALDDYGKSKSLGEPISDCMVIRTSIIGEEIHKNASLIEWAKAQKGKKVNGFTHHKWNGITTKTYARVCDQIMTEGLWEKGLYHVHASGDVTKFEMMNYFNERFDLNLDIAEVSNMGSPCDRTLRTTKPLLAKLDVPSVKEQVMSI
jgi:dTDP-4-dehydrorhamnose reductase